VSSSLIVIVRRGGLERFHAYRLVEDKEVFVQLGKVLVLILAAFLLSKLERRCIVIEFDRLVLRQTLPVGWLE
jgi:hypothetical protein